MWQRALSAAFALTLISTSTSAWANLKYEFNTPVGSGSAVGWVETDGTIGVLSTANLQDWQFTLTSANFTTSSVTISSDNATSATGIFGTGVTATSAGLFFDFSNPGTVLNFFALAPELSANAFFCLTAGPVNCGGEPTPSKTIGVGFPLPLDIAETTAMAGSGNTLVATKAVPEPATLALMGLGIAGMAARRRSKR